ncbi:MAG: hypothetical protein JNL76_00245 [Alphaproteobacteria bacterium]|nr:hypothetical protein [Alphaproteobacteria bacterium]
MGSDELEKHIGSEAIPSAPNLEFYQGKLRAAGNNKVSLDLYQHIVNWEIESAQLRRAGQGAQERLSKRFMAFKRVLFDLAVEGYDSFTVEDRRIIVWHLQFHFLPISFLFEYYQEVEWMGGETIQVRRQQLDLAQDLFNSYYKKHPFISIFQMVHLYGLAEKFEQKCDLKEFSSQFRTAYKNWKRQNAKFIAECAARNAVTNPPQKIDSMPAIEDAAVEPPSGETPAVVGANDNPVPEEPSPDETNPEMAASSSCANPRIREIFVRRPLVTSGNNTEGMGYAPDGEGNDEALSSPVGDTFEKRTQALINHILADDTSFPFAYMTVVWDQRPVKTEGIAEKPYNLIYLEMEDESRTCLAVCDYRGHTTYVERDAPPYQDTDILQISELKKNPKVWTIPHVTHEQWTSGLHTLVYTPLEQLTIDPKTRSYWYSLKDALIQSFATTIMASGKIPATNDKAAIAFGPLKDHSKWCNAYQAVNRRAISGLPEGVTSFKTLFNALANGYEGAKAPLPELKKFLNKAPVTEAMIEAACKRFKEEYDLPLAPDFFDALMIDPVDTRFNKETEPDLSRTGKDIDLAFAFGAVVLSPERVAKLGRYPSGLQDYLELIGYGAVGYLPAPACKAA